jgi:hypothetical protein
MTIGFTGYPVTIGVIVPSPWITGRDSLRMGIRYFIVTRCDSMRCPDARRCRLMTAPRSPWSFRTRKLYICICICLAIAKTLLRTPHLMWIFRYNLIDVTRLHNPNLLYFSCRSFDRRSSFLLGNLLVTIFLTFSRARTFYTANPRTFRQWSPSNRLSLWMTRTDRQLFDIGNFSGREISTAILTEINSFTWMTPKNPVVPLPISV